MTEGPYKLPKGWEWMRLGDVGRIFAGSSAPQDDIYFENGVFPFVRVQDLGRHGVTTNLLEIKDMINERAIRECHLVKARKGTILFPKSGAAVLTNSRAILGRDAYIVSHLAAVEVNQTKVEPLFAFYWLCTVDMGQYIDNPAYPSLRLSKIAEIRIPLPPLEEQRRIVARIEELMGRIREARRLREEAKQEAERLWQAVLAETFPRPGSPLPPGWRWASLREVGRIFAGSSAPQNSIYFENGTFPFVRVRDLSRHGITTNLVETEDQVNEQALKDCHLVKARKGTILFPKSGAAILTNSRAILGVDAYIVSHLAAIEVNPSLVDPLFAFYWLCTIDMGQHIENPAYPSLRLSQIASIQILLPPLSEQRRIVSYLETVQKRVKVLKEAQAQVEQKIKSLEQVILDHAFRGEL
ncbi:MAG: restriction endonuclease subunit S [Thermosphaera sp.]